MLLRPYDPLLMRLAYVCHNSSVVNAFASCPADPDEAADAYVLKRMSPGEAEEFDLHLVGCPRCRQIVETTRAFKQALRDAAHDLPKTKAAHPTEAPTAPLLKTSPATGPLAREHSLEESPRSGPGPSNRPTSQAR